MKKLDNIVEIKTPEMKLEIDPRSMTTANKAARNEIAVGSSENTAHARSTMGAESNNKMNSSFQSD